METKQGKTKLCDLCERSKKEGKAICAKCCKCCCGEECIKFVHKNSSVKKGAQGRSPSQKVLLQMWCVLSTKNNAPNMFYIDDVKLCCVLCMWKENRCKDYSVIDFIWDFTKQRGTLSCWCEEVLYWFSEVRWWWTGQEGWRAIENIQRGTCKKAGGRKREKRKGKEGKSSRVSEMRMRRHRRRNWSSWEKHVNTTEC